MAETSDQLCCWNEIPTGRERLWCKICRNEGKAWLSPEPCSHILNAQNPEKVTMEVAMNTLRALLSESSSQENTDPQ